MIILRTATHQWSCHQESHTDWKQVVHQMWVTSWQWDYPFRVPAGLHCAVHATHLDGSRSGCRQLLWCSLLLRLLLFVGRLWCDFVTVVIIITLFLLLALRLGLRLFLLLLVSLRSFVRLVGQVFDRRRVDVSSWTVSFGDIRVEQWANRLIHGVTTWCATRTNHFMVKLWQNSKAKYCASKQKNVIAKCFRCNGRETKFEFFINSVFKGIEPTTNGIN